jgi:hypothetical protein
MSIEKVDKNKVQPITPASAGKDAKKQSEENAEAERQLPKTMPIAPKKKPQPKNQGKKEDNPVKPPETTGDGHIDTYA